MHLRVFTSLVALILAATAAVAVGDPGDPGEPVRLNGDLAGDIDFPRCRDGSDRYWFSPDAEWVLYRARVDHRLRDELFAVRTDGTEHHKVSVPIANRQSVGGPWFAGDGTTVVYTVPHPSIEGGSQVYATPIEGGPSELLASMNRLAWLDVTPDGETVVYIQPDDLVAPELYRVPVAGGAPTLLAAIPAWSAVPNTVLTPDGSTVLLARRIEGPVVPLEQLFTVSLEDGELAPLDTPMGADGEVVGHVQVAQDSSHVVFMARQNPQVRVDELFSAPLDGGAGARLSRAFPEGGDTKDFTITPDSSRVIYRADQRTNNQRELFSVPIGGGIRTRLSGSLPAAGDVSVYEISPDSATVVYRADQRANNRHELFAVPTMGGDITRLNDSLPAGGDVKTDQRPKGCTADPSVAHQITADSSTVVYLADQDEGNVRELYAVPIGGGDPVKLNAALGGKRDVHRFALAPDATRVVYSADQDTDNVRELYSSRLDGRRNTELSGPFPPGGDVMTAITYSPDGRQVAYVADQLTNGVRELFIVGDR